MSHDLGTVLESHPRWWVELCNRHGQHPGDPDAFWNVPPAEPQRLVAEAKAEHGEKIIQVEVEDLGF